VGSQRSTGRLHAPAELQGPALRPDQSRATGIVSDSGTDGGWVGQCNDAHWTDAARHPRRIDSEHETSKAAASVAGKEVPEKA